MSLRLRILSHCSALRPSSVPGISPPTLFTKMSIPPSCEAASDELAAALLAREIGDDPDRLHTEPLQLLHRRIQALRAARRECDVTALFRERGRDGEADTLARPRDRRVSSLQS